MEICPNIFFHDILLYSSSIQQQHKEHLELVLKILLGPQLYAKASKWKFGCHEVEYLGI